MILREIETDRLRIRLFRPSDAARIMQYRSAPELKKFLSWPKSQADLDAAIANASEKLVDGTWSQFGIARKVDDHLVGDCAIKPNAINPRTAEIGIAIAPEFHGQGYAKEALSALFSVLFIECGFHRIFFSVDPANVSSCALMERLRMRKEGHFKQSLWYRDEWVDDVIYAILASEWKSL